MCNPVRYLTRPILLVLAGLFATCTHASETFEHRVEELPYGVALYDFFQGKYFSSITDILVAKKTGTISDPDRKAELLLGGLYLSYGMQDSAHSTFTAITQQDDHEIPLNALEQALFQIGKSHFIEGQDTKAEKALLAIATDGQPSTLEPVYEAERLFMLGELYMRRKAFDDAILLLERYPDDVIWQDYSRFNLGVRLITHDREEEGMAMLAPLSAAETADRERGMLYDQASLALAASFSRNGEPGEAVRHFERIKLDHQQSNSALLGLGWVRFSQSAYDKAIRTWSVLAGRPLTSDDVQQVLILIPYALEQQGHNRLALAQYTRAVDLYDRHIQKIDQAEARIRNGELVEIFRANATSEKVLDATDITGLLGPEMSSYLFDLIASTEFERAVNRHRELAVLLDKLEQWERTIPSLQQVLKEKISAYENRLSAVVNSPTFEQAKRLRERRDILVARLDKALTTDSIRVLATEQEVELLDLAASIETMINVVGDQDPDIEELRDRHRFLTGLLTWTIDTDYAPRLWAIRKDLKELDGGLQDMDNRIASLKTVWRTEPARHARYKALIDGKRERIEALQTEVRTAMAAQASSVQAMAEAGIARYRAQLKSHQDRAQYRRARVYDALVMSQTDVP